METDNFFEMPGKKNPKTCVACAQQGMGHFYMYLGPYHHSSLYSVLPLIFSLCFNSLTCSNLVLLHCTYLRGPFQVILRKGDYKEQTAATAKQLS